MFLMGIIYSYFQSVIKLIYNMYIIRHSNFINKNRRFSPNKIISVGIKTTVTIL